MHVVPTEQQGLKIYTLGRFQVKRGDQVLSQDSTRSYRVWELFKYIIANRQKGVVPELALENLWPEQEYADPRGAVRALIFRLRKYLGQSSGEQDYILFTQGCYQWNGQTNYWLDAEVFEQTVQAALEVRLTDPDKAEAFFFDAVNLYQGDFLPESYYSQWTIPVRNYYHTLYLQVVLDLIDHLKSRAEYGKIISLCEQALLTHPYEEDLHQQYLETLMKEGRVQQAQNHYNFVSRKFYQDLGIKPSGHLQKIIQLSASDESGLNLAGIQNRLSQPDETQGGFVCDAEVFREIYKLERRRSERSGMSVFLVLLTVAGKESAPNAAQASKMEDLEKYLITSLRKGDVISRWNQNQYLLMLPGLAYEQGEKVMERLKYGFNAVNRTVIISTEIQPVLPLEIYT